MKDIWKTFDTAPKDGTWILAFSKKAVKINATYQKNTAPMVIAWKQWMEPQKFCPEGSGKQCWRDDEGTKYREDMFSHWASIPPGPDLGLFEQP